MKRYVSAILIPCFLFQVFGCYSMKQMTIAELKSYDGDNDIVLKTRLGDVIINRKSCKDSSMNWVASNNLITINVTKPVTMENYKNLNSKDLYEAMHEESELKYSDIENITSKEIDILNTTGVAVGCILIACVIIFVIANLPHLPNSFTLKESKNVAQ